MERKGGRRGGRGRREVREKQGERERGERKGKGRGRGRRGREGEGRGKGGAEKKEGRGGEQSGEGGIFKAVVAALALVLRVPRRAVEVGTISARTPAGRVLVGTVADDDRRRLWEYILIVIIRV